jgi:hypothetical protein
MKKITLFSILAVLFAAMSFTSCNSSSDNGIQLPTKQEAYNMMLTVGGSHQCGILFPADKNNNIQKKDSIITNITINPSDSTYLISDFPVKLLAKYVKNEKYSKLISELPNQTLSGKLYPVDATSLFFYTATNNITFKDEQNNNYTMKFYALNGYAAAGLDQTKKNFLLYLTPGAIFNGNEIVNDAFKTAVGTHGPVPYIMVLTFKK